ncbi:ATP-dependent acyl-CoA ligase [Sporichthya brevicatena]|uniref:ATP-dependent acyl-CoA ligase n=1 Tax=Sporichthya brevicatena TaxID=171442 RepID=A0ABN1G3Z1_9ACTN
MPHIDGGWNSAPIGGWMLGEEDAIVPLLQRRLDTHGDKLFLDFSGEQYTYAQVYAESARLARGLRAQGVGRGDTVASLLDNGPDAAFLMIAVHQLGAIYAPINTAFKGEYLRHQVADCSTRILVTESDYAERVFAIVDQIPDVELLLHRGDVPQGDPGKLRVESIDAHRLDGAEDPSVEVLPSDTAFIIYTGGTTGPSKGCELSHAYAIRMSAAANWVSQRQEDELNWNPAPLFHMNAVTSIIGSALVGGAASIAPRFSVSGFWREIERTGARVVNLLGVMIPLIAGMDDTEEMARCKGQIRAVAGAPFNPKTEAVWRERYGVALVGNPFYGLTECAPLTVMSLSENKPGACGRPADDLDVRIFGDEDQELPPGEVGEIVCRALRPNTLFKGYWRRPQATVDVMGNQWFHTGDLGKFDDEGWLYFVDRKKDYLRRGGENISSVELEISFMQHPAVAEVAVHAVKSELSEDEVKVTVVRKSDAAVTEEELCLWSVDRLPYFAVPRYIEFRDALPKNGVGRITKYQLRDEGVTAATWDRVAAGVTFERR